MDKKSTPLSNEQIRELMRLSMRTLSPRSPKDSTLQKIIALAHS